MEFKKGVRIRYNLSKIKIWKFPSFKLSLSLKILLNILALNFIGKFELPQEEPKELTQEELDELEKLRKKREKKREYNYRYLKKKKASMEKIMTLWSA